MNNNQGFILIMVLFILQICALLGLYALEASWIENKISRYDWQRHSIENAVEQLLKDLEQSCQDGLPQCVIPIISSETLKTEPLSWWQTQSCSGNFQSIQYYYVIESLGTDPCAELQTGQGQIANYYRLTLFALKDAVKIMIQSTIVKPEETSLKCENKKHFVLVGRQAWSTLLGG